MVIPIISVVGRSNSGKTTLLEKLIRLLVARGWRVGTIKHHFHGPVEVDTPGKDSWRHRQAGASAAALSSRDTLFVVRQVAGEVPLEVIAHRGLFDVDLILTEGFRSGPMPKIEVNRAALGVPLLCTAGDALVAVVADWSTGAAVPHFGLEAIPELADFLERQYLKVTEPPCVEVLVGDRRVALDLQAQEILARVVRSLVGDCRDLSDGPPIEIRIPSRTS
jgi:molybdopterin-guanine dinucleotide biosynthesis protein B